MWQDHGPFPRAKDLPLDMILATRKLKTIGEIQPAMSPIARPSRSAMNSEDASSSASVLPRTGPEKAKGKPGVSEHALVDSAPGITSPPPTLDESIPGDFGEERRSLPPARRPNPDREVKPNHRPEPPSGAPVGG